MLVVEQGYGDKVFEYQVDCEGVEGQELPQAFLISIPVDGPNDTRRLAWFRRSYVILDEERKQPAYLLLDEIDVVACTNVRLRGDSQKVFAFVE